MKGGTGKYLLGRVLHVVLDVGKTAVAKPRHVIAVAAIHHAFAGGHGQVGIVVGGEGGATDHELPHVAEVHHADGDAADAAQDRDQQRHQHQDDRDDRQQLDKGEPAFLHVRETIRRFWPCANAYLAGRPPASAAARCKPAI
jgi:hypothetical protein